MGPLAELLVPLFDPLEIPADMAPAISQTDVFSERLVGFVGGIPIHAEDPLRLRAEMLLGYLRGTGRVQDESAGLPCHDHPEPPFVADLASKFREDHPSRFVHVPVARLAASFKDGNVERLNEFSDPLEASRERALRDLESLQREDLPDAVERPLEEELLHQEVDPEPDGEHALGD